MLLAQEAVPHMRPGSAMVFISSYTAFNPTPPIAMYAVSKTALLGLTKALAEELGPDGIRVNCVAPGEGGAGCAAGRAVACGCAGAPGSSGLGVTAGAWQGAWPWVCLPTLSNLFFVPATFQCPAGTRCRT